MSFSAAGLIIAALMSGSNIFTDVARKKAVQKHALIPATFWCQVSAAVIFGAVLLPDGLLAIDAQHPNTVALLFGPLALFGINAPQSRFSRGQLLQAMQQGSTGTGWRVESAVAPVTFHPFPEIRDQQYRLYHQVES